MKKLIAFTLCVLLILPTLYAPQIALASSKTLSDFPAAFESLTTSTSNLYQDAASIGGWRFANQTSGSDYLKVCTDSGAQGSYIELTHDSTSTTSFALVLSPAKTITSCLDISFDLKISDWLVTRDFILGSSNPKILTINSKGYLSVFGKTLKDNLNSNVVLETDEWYNLSFKYNIATSYYVFSLTKKDNGVVFSSSGFYINSGATNVATHVSTLQNNGISQIRFFQMGTGNKEASKLALDNINVSEASPIYKDFMSEATFTSSDDISGLTISLPASASVSSDGLSLATSSPLTVKKEFDTGLYGKYRFEIVLGGFTGDARRSVNLGADEILTFSDGSIYCGATNIGDYDSAAMYKVVIKANTIANNEGKMPVDVSVVPYQDVQTFSLPSALSGTTALTSASITDICISIEPDLSSDTSTVVKSLNCYSDFGMHLISSTPNDGAADIDPCSVSLLFTNPVQDIASLKVNGEANGTYLVNSTKRNEVSLDVSAYLEYEKENTVSFDATDIFGETKAYTIKLTTKPKYEFGDILITSSASNVTASVTGKANDGNTYNFDLILANFSSSNGKLLSLDKTSFALTPSAESYTCTSVLSDGSFYIAYLWDGISTMKSILPQKTFGTPAAFAVDSSAQGFKQDPATGIVSAKIAGINNVGSSFMVLHPSKTMADISGASNLTDVISYIAQYDDLTSDYISFPVAGGGGSYGVAVNSDGNVVFTPSAIEYIDIAYINLVRDAINAPVINVKNLVALYNDVLDVDDTYINSLSLQQETSVNSAVTESRDALSGHVFSTFKEFTDAYYDALCLSLIKYAKGSADAKAVLTSYADKVALSSFGTYSAYSNLSNEAKEYVYSRIANRKVNALSELESLFNDSVILASVKHAAYQQDIGKVISDHKAYMSLDVSVYNTVSNTGNVHTALLGKDFSDIRAFKTAFNTAVQNQKAAEGSTSQGPVSNVGSTSSSSGLSSVSLPSVSAPSQDTPNVFGDIASYEWASEAINYLAKNNVISGKTNGIFAPSDYITREEFAKIAVMAFVGYTDANNSGFNDVAPDSWYAPYVAKAKETGLVNGIGEGTFGVGRCITREDIAVILCRAASLKGISLTNGTSSFADSAMISDYAKSAVDTLYSSKVINGTPDGSFNPKAFATRAEAAKMLYEIIKKGGGI